MNQIYNNDPYVEVGFFYEMANLLNGVKRKEQFNAFPCYQVQCPNCGKSAARMGFFSRANTFAIQCPVNGCVLNKRKNRKGLLFMTSSSTTEAMRCLIAGVRKQEE